MSRSWRWRGLGGVVVGLGLSLATGCQTWIGGMTLPSPDYLKDHPDYIPQQPVFKLPNEMAAMQAAAGGVLPPGGEVPPPPPPAVAPGAPGPGPALVP